jgi:hypothetical protein
MFSECKVVEWKSDEPRYRQSRLGSQVQLNHGSTTEHIADVREDYEEMAHRMRKGK